MPSPECPPVVDHGSAGELSGRKEIQAELDRLNRLEIIGRLVGRVEHDFINLLAVIKGYATQGGLIRGLRKETIDSFRQIDQVANSAIALVRRLSSFGKRTPAKTLVTNLNKLIRTQMPRWTRMLGAHITLRASLSPRAAYVEIGRGQFEQILKILMDNAREAMPQGGSVIIQTELLTSPFDGAEGKLISRGGKNPADLSYVHMAVTDTGVGMDEATKSRICEPFFSTKTKGQHAGLGLATVFAIMAQNNGAMRVFSELGQGTSVHLYLPKASPNRSHSSHSR
jgi:two-component system cell cycle sensor histidine kinase/response regulator CckA